MSHIDFIGIGAPKCGTTWLSAQLEAHPQIGFAPDKEVYYFADTILRRIAGKELRCFERGDAGITSNFRPPSDQFPAAESFVPPIFTRRKPPPGSPLTGRHQTAALPAAAGRDDLLVVLVQPERCGGVLARVVRGDDGKSVSPRPRMLRRHLKPYLDRFPAKNILVVQFDAIRRDPDRVRQRTYEF
jgi:hypothetical protein